MTHDEYTKATTTTPNAGQAVDAITGGRTVLGIEFGSTRIKSCLILPDGTSVATGSHEWENSLVDGHWSYSLDDIWAGLQDSIASLLEETLRTYGVRPTAFAALGISAMMHGYLALDADGELLVPFRTWRDTYTGRAAAELTDLFGQNIPLRWSIAHLHQAVLDGEDHVGQIDQITTLAGYVHQRLTGENVLGVGDAVGMFPVDSSTGDYDITMADAFDTLLETRAADGEVPQRPAKPLTHLLPRILSAGEQAGRVTEEGAKLLDPTGTITAGAPCCPPEGDAGTGMVATNAVRRRTGNVSVGTSIFAMAVLERDLTEIHHEIDLVATPAGDPVAMVHCNNGTSELSAWINLLSQVAFAFGRDRVDSMDDIYRVLLTEVLNGDPDAGGLLACNYLSGEPITGLEEGRPLFVRGPESTLTTGNFLRSQLYSSFATLATGMEVLAGEGVELDVLHAHGGLFRTPGVPQKLLSAAMKTRVGVADSASEGGAWGIALLALYLDHASRSLPDFLDDTIFADEGAIVVEPDPRDVKGFETYLERYRAVLELERTAVDTVPS